MSRHHLYPHPYPCCSHCGPPDGYIDGHARPCGNDGCPGNEPEVVSE